jgi:cation diffusion facilitator CzcD-associated flavoprotein CzcO
VTFARQNDRVPESTVVVVGGGASGLATAAALTRRGIPAVVLEQDAAIGGTWARRYQRLRLHTMREFSGLAHLPIPKRYPRYLARDQVVEYLREYVRHFRLRVVTGTTVRRIRTCRGGWEVETTETEPWRARVVVVATGQYREPFVPPWPGLTAYQGRFLHSAAYVCSAPFAGQRVLVVGAGNSGAEIATDLAEGDAASVAVSVRTPPPIVPRDPFGLPVQRTSILLSALPSGIADAIGRTTARLALGDLTAYGMPQASFTPYRRRHVPLIDVGFVAALKRGLIRIRPAVTALTARGAIVADGTDEPCDAIVAATGFTTGLGALLEAPDVLDEAGEPRSGSGEPSARPGLFFIGFIHSLRGHLFEANRDARRLARHVERYLQPQQNAAS